MDNLGPLVVLTGAVIGSWVIFELQGGHEKKKRSQFSRYLTILLVLLGLVFGWLIRLSTGNSAVLVILGLAITITFLSELGRLF